jgi:hypothetical protein
VIAVSEETAAISLAMSGEMTRDLDGPRLRGALRDVFTRSGRREALEAETREEADERPEIAPAQTAPADAHPRAGGA